MMWNEVSCEPTAAVKVVQPGVPSYRVDFFERLARHYGNSFRVYHSALGMGALTEREKPFPWEEVIGPILALPAGLQWQKGAGNIPISRGDIIVLWGTTRSLSNLPLIIRARYRGAKLVWWGHYQSATSRPWRQALRVFFMRSVHGLMFYTEHEVSTYLKTVAGVLDSRPVGALNNGINTVPIAAYRNVYESLKREASALFIGRLRENCGLDLALEALASDENTRLSLHIIGDGEGKEGLQSLAFRLGLKDRVIWHGAITNESQIAEIANKCRFFVYCGGVGLSLIHGFAYGLPAVVHNEFEAHGPEIASLTPGINGVTFRRDDTKDLVRVIGSLVKDTNLLDQMSKAALSTVEKEFNTSQMARRFINLLCVIAQR